MKYAKQVLRIFDSESVISGSPASCGNLILILDTSIAMVQSSRTLKSYFSYYYLIFFL